MDSFDPHPGHLRYSWDSLRSHRHNPRHELHPPRNRVLRRLDWVYFSQGGTGPIGLCTSTILPGFAFSDHAPVWATLNFAPPSNCPSSFRMNASHFDHPTYKQRIVAMWEAVGQRGTAGGWSPFDVLQKSIRGARLIDRCWEKRMAKERRFRLEGLQACMTKAQLELEVDPNNATSQLNVLLTKEALLTFCAAQANWVELIMQSRWLMEGNRGTKLFYKSFKSLAAGKEIHELLDADGNIKRSWEDLASLATDFFSGILGESLDALDIPVDVLLTEEVLSVQSDRLYLEDKTELNAPLTLEELGESVGDLANGNCPGPDGTPIKFYKANWGTVGPLILDYISKSITEERFPAFITKGAIVLLKKKDDQRVLGNKRSITLLNSVYKIYWCEGSATSAGTHSAEDHLASPISLPPWP